MEFESCSLSLKAATAVGISTNIQTKFTISVKARFSSSYTCHVNDIRH